MKKEYYIIGGLLIGGIIIYLLNKKEKIVDMGTLKDVAKDLSEVAPKIDLPEIK